MIIHFEIHVYLHFPVSLYIQSLSFIDCNGTMVVLFIRDVVCVRGGWKGSPLFQNCYSHELQLLSTDLFDLYFRAGRRRMLSCVLYMGTYRCIVHIESAVKQSLRASSWFSWYRTPYKFNLSHSVPKSNQLRWLSLVQSIWTKALGEFRTPVYLQFTSLLS